MLQYNIILEWLISLWNKLICIYKENLYFSQVTLEFRDSSDSVISQAQPGDDVKVQINTEAGSVVGLLSVDKSVLLLAGGNDITQAQVLVYQESTCTSLTLYNMFMLVMKFSYAATSFLYFPLYNDALVYDSVVNKLIKFY